MVFCCQPMLGQDTRLLCLVFYRSGGKSDTGVDDKKGVSNHLRAIGTFLFISQNQAGGASAIIIQVG